MAKGGPPTKPFGSGQPVPRGGRFAPGTSGNPGGRPSLAKTIIAAGYNPKELRTEIVQLAVNAVRDVDTDPASWRYAHDYLAGICGIRPPKEMVLDDARGDARFDESALTDEQIDQAIDAIDKLTEMAVIEPADDDAPTEH